MKAYLEKLCATADSPLTARHQLNHALAQSGWTGARLSPDNWRDYVRQRVERLDWQKEVSRDIEAFIILSDWEKDLTKESLLALLERRPNAMPN